MSIETTAAHWSLWQLDQLLAELVLPEEPADPIRSWGGRWDLLETTGTAERTHITGGLELVQSPFDGGILLEIVHEVPEALGWSVLTTGECICLDDRMLSPVQWSLDFASMYKYGTKQFTDTVSSQEGWVLDGLMQLEGVDSTTIELASRDHLSCSYSLMAALPRLFQDQQQELNFMFIEDLLVPRDNQVLTFIGEIVVQTAEGALTLCGYLHYGKGVPPVHYWLGPRGFPLLVGGLGRALVATEITQETPGFAGK